MSERRHEIEASSEFADRYQLEELVGAGGFARVFRGVQRSTGQTVAVKILERPAAADSGSPDARAARFRREVELCAGLHHPNVVRLIDGGSTSTGWLYTVFNYVPGRTLDRLLAEEGPLDPQEAAHLLGQVLDAIGCAHRRGIIHRDLKPSNVMVSETGLRRNALVLDFGIGTFTAELRERELRHMTATPEALGTPSYAAPEQLRGEAPTVRSDLYSWGLILLESLTGVPPVRGATLQEVLERQLGPEPVEIPDSVRGLPIGRAIAAATAKRPEERASSAEELAGWVLDPATLLSSSPRPTPGARESVRQLTVVSMRLSGNGTQAGLEAREEQLRSQQEKVLAIVRTYGGSVVATLGSRILAVFGYPSTREEPAGAALQAAAVACEAVGGGGEGDGIRLRAGVHSGLVIAGPGMAGRAHLSSPVVDGAFDLEERAEAGEVWLGDATRRLLRTAAQLEPMGEHTLQGEDRPMPLFRLKGGPRAIAPGEAPSLRTPLVGRARELAQLEAAWASACAGAPAAQLVSGEAGIGKSRLLRELRRRLASDAWVECRCTPESRNSPLQPIVAWLRTWAERAPVAESLAELGVDPQRVQPFLLDLLDLPADPGSPMPPLSPERKRQRTLEAVLEVLFASARQRPLVFAVEDLHWADPTTLDLLQLLLQQVRSAEVFDPEPRLPLLTILSARPDFAPSWSVSDVSLLQLPRLSRDEAAELVRAGAGADFPADVVDQLVRRADGIPLFLEEVARMLSEGTQALDEVPETLRDLLSARIDRLEEAVRETAQTAACLGREFDFALLRAVSDRPEPLLRDDLDALIRGRVLYRRTGLHGERYFFAHALLRDAAHESMLGSERRGVHLRIASSLEGPSFKEVAAREPERLAFHFEEAGLVDRAIEYRGLAATSASARSAQRESIHHYERAIALLLSRPASSERDERELALRLGVGNAYVETLGYASAPVERSFERASELCSRMAGSPRLFSAINGLWGYHLNRGDPEATDRLVRTQAEIADQSLRDVHVLLARYAAGVTSFLSGDLVRALPLLEEGTRLYERAYDERMARGPARPWRIPAISSPLYLAWCQNLVGLPDRALARVTDAVERAGRLGPFSQVEALTYLVAVLHDRREPEPTLELSDRILALCKEYGFGLWRAVGTSARGWARCHLGAVEEGLVEGRRGLDVYLATGANVPLVYRASYLADALLVAGRCREGLAVLDEAAQRARGRLDRFYDAEMLRLRGDLLLREGARQAALEEYRRAGALARSQGAKLLELRAATSLARLLADDAPPAEVRAPLAAVYAGFEEGFDTPDLREAREVLARLT